MSKEKYPRLTDGQFSELVAAIVPTEPYAACLVCNEIISMAFAPKVRQKELEDHEENSKRHLAFVDALNTDPEERV